MKLELKNVKINESFSEETTMFKADLFVNGVKVAYANNDGRGGCTFYSSYEGKRVLLVKAEEYANGLPSKFYDFGLGEHEIKSNLEGWIDDTIHNICKEKDKLKAEKKILKACDTAIVWGNPNKNNYKQWGFKEKINLSLLYNTPSGKDSINNLVSKVKAELQADEIIFNKNIPI